jgi:uncharacterized integral membrane protein (TIGR00698 family)
VVAVAAWALGLAVPTLGAPLVALLFGMAITYFVTRNQVARQSFLRINSPGIEFVSKKVLQAAIVLLGFGLNLSIIAATGLQSLLVIAIAILVGLLAAFLLKKVFRLPNKLATLIGVGSAICGGSAIAATAPIIEADENEVATAISVVVFFNVLAVFLFPILGQSLGMDAHQFGVFAGAAINDTSSVTAAASLWDSRHHLGTTTLDIAVTVKLIRTLAIIPISIVLSLFAKGKRRRASVPSFILLFIAAALIATFANLPPIMVNSLRTASRFMIVMAMAAIGLKTNIGNLIKTASKPLLLGGICSLAIATATLIALVL